MNVGAKTPTDYGDYYAWGETKTKSDYSQHTYMCSISDCGGKNDPVTLNGYKSIDGTRYDVAHVKWGGTWKMPTTEQIKELYNSDYCTTTWTSNYNGTGVAGYIITSKVKGYAGNFIFLPAAGCRGGSELFYDGSTCYYWSATRNSYYVYNANYLHLSLDDIGWHSYYRCSGQPVRPVSE